MDRDKATSVLRLMATAEVAKVVNESTANRAGEMSAVVIGLGDELVVFTPTHEFVFDVKEVRTK